ncbi:MAG: transcriptional repressor NrdR [Oscillospiraceae bacterium]|nr:transcriptional repressor NrdR [Oscillospiraceae bacterium]
MRCPFCSYTESKVIDSRPAEEGASIRRRRECLSCGKRFTTYEIIERLPLLVVKKDGSRQSFDRTKVINGLVKACEKRPVSAEQIEKIADEIEQELQGMLEREVPSERVGEMVMKHLKDLDEVAYVRFASVYRSFKDINTFLEELNKLLKEKI